jgi:hypothetical protein
MPLVETLFLTLGPAVARAILKSWLQSDVADAWGYAKDPSGLPWT